VNVGKCECIRACDCVYVCVIACECASLCTMYVCVCVCSSVCGLHVAGALEGVLLTAASPESPELSVSVVGV